MLLNSFGIWVFIMYLISNIILVQGLNYGSCKPVEFEFNKKTCEDSMDGSVFCIGFLKRSREIILCRPGISECENEKIIVKVEIKSSNGPINLHIVGGQKYGWMGIGFANTFDNLMQSGSPVIVTEPEIGHTKLWHMGTNNPQEIGGGMLVHAPDDSLVNWKIDFGHCTGKVAVLDVTLTPTDTLDIYKSSDKIHFNRPIHIVLGQGDSDYRLKRPRKHIDNDRGKSRYKFTLNEPYGGVEARIYRHCGVDSYCFGIGKDGCGRVSFDCDLFLRIKKDKAQSAIFLLQGKYDGAIALGFSETPMLSIRHRWKHLTRIIECEPGTGNRKAYMVTGCDYDRPGSCQLTIDPSFPYSDHSIPNEEKLLPTSHQGWTQCEFEISHGDLDTKLGLVDKKHNLLLLGRINRQAKSKLLDFKLPPNDINIQEITNFTNSYVDYKQTKKIGTGNMEALIFENFIVVQLDEKQYGIDPFNFNPTRPSQAQVNYITTALSLLLGFAVIAILRFINL